MIRIHERDGARLTRETAFGRDPLRNNPNLQNLRERLIFILILALFLKIFFMETVNFAKIVCFTSFYSPEDMLHCYPSFPLHCLYIIINASRIFVIALLTSAIIIIIAFILWHAQVFQP